MIILSIAIYLSTCIICEGGGVRNFSSQISPKANTDWGTWGPAEFCPDLSFALGYQLKGQNQDEGTALNCIKLFCSYNFDIYNPDANLEAGTVRSSAGPLGEWTIPTFCPEEEEGNFINEVNFMKGTQFQSEPSQGSFSDDSAGNNFKMQCMDGTIVKGNSLTNWGTWSSWVYCPSGTAICGLKNKVDYPPYGFAWARDDTGLNAVIFYCCDVPPMQQSEIVNFGEGK